MTQTPPKPNAQNNTNGRISSVRNLPIQKSIPVQLEQTDQLNFQEPVGFDAQVIQEFDPGSVKSNLTSSSVGLRTQLLMTILPSVLVPLVFASILGYITTNQKLEEKFSNRWKTNPCWVENWLVRF
jgi:hypothetical protein